MALPFFYKADLGLTTKHVVLDEDASRHIVQVLRMQTGEQMLLTNGNGDLFTAEIIDANRKKCEVKILSSTTQPPPSKKITIAISLVKNSTRFEWFLEKATEIGIGEIIPLLCSRTEKQHFRHERMKNILVSAMLQSQQTWLPFLHEPTKFSTFINTSRAPKKFIAHCEAGEPRVELSACQPFGDSIMLIGPEGDFSLDEIAQALQNDFLPVALGNTRLRTETAGVAAAVLLQLI